MYSLLFLAATSFLFAYALTPLIRDGFIRLAIVDHPGESRKIHSDPTPRVGGIAIALSCLLAVGALILTPLQGGNLVARQLPFFLRLLPSVALVFAVGLLDDLVGLRPWQKLIGQVAAAGLACWAGVRMDSVVGRQLDAWWGIPLTLLWLVACSNAFNLIDGVDGLAAGTGLLAASTILVGGLLQGNPELLFATVPLVGALLAFLRYNFHPASIFLGDCGSLTLGFLLGCYGIIWSQKSTTLLGMTAPLIALGLPLLDTTLTFSRRFLRSQPIFNADREHIHHRLLDRGLTPRRVVFLLYMVSGIAAVLSLLQSVASNRFGGLIIVLFCAVAWLGIQQLGYSEFQLTGRMFFQGAFRGMIAAQLSLQNFERSLTAAADLDRCWMILRNACWDFGFNYVQLRVNAGGDQKDYVDSSSDSDHGWMVRMSLGNGSWIVLKREFGSRAHPTVLVPLLDALERILPAKLEEFATAGPVAAPTPSTQPAESYPAQ